MPSRGPLAECPAKHASPFEIAQPISRKSTRILQGDFAFFGAGQDSAQSFPRPPWTRCRFGSEASPEEIGSGVAPGPSLPQRGVDL